MEALNLSQFPIPRNHRDLEALFYDRYDELIRVACPDYDEMLDLMVGCIPAGADGLLDLGCGTGNLLSLAAERLPALKRIVGVDFSDQVLDRARERLSGEKDRVELINLDIRTGELPGIGLRTSALTLHNLPPSVQMTLYLKILQDASCFIHYDAIRGATAAEERERWDYLKWWMTQQRVPAGVQQMALNHMQEEDQPLTIDQHRKLCASANMTFRVIRHSPGFVVFVAERRKS